MLGLFKMLLKSILIICLCVVIPAVSALDSLAAAASFEALDANQDGRISVSEARKDKTLSVRFASADVNQDGYLDKKEFDAANNGKQ